MDKSQNPTGGTAPVIYNWSVEKYISAVENTQNPILKEYEQTEIDYISSIPDLSKKTVIDVGAGYGRVLPHIAPPQNSKCHRC